MRHTDLAAGQTWTRGSGARQTGKRILEVGQRKGVTLLMVETLSRERAREWVSAGLFTAWIERVGATLKDNKC